MSRSGAETADHEGLIHICSGKAERSSKKHLLGTAGRELIMNNRDTHWNLSLAPACTERADFINQRQSATIEFRDLR